MLEIVRGFSGRPRPVNLGILGHYNRPGSVSRRGDAAAGDEVRFLGGVYEPDRPNGTDADFAVAAEDVQADAGGDMRSLPGPPSTWSKGP